VALASRRTFFGTANFAVVAGETYARGMRHFPEDEMGLPCNFAVSRTAGSKTDNDRAPDRAQQDPAGDVRQLQRTHVPGRDRCGHAHGRPTSRRVPGRHHPARTPARPSWATPARPTSCQEFCNALFDALFNILPLGTDPTPVAHPARADQPLGRRRQALLQEFVQGAAGAGADLCGQALARPAPSAMPGAPVKSA
jgi:chlorophyllide a reductase subunit Z